MKLHVIFRTCEIVEAMHGTSRPFGLNKSQVIDICFQSLLQSLQQLSIPVEMTIIGDELSKQREQFFASHGKVIVGKYGNGGSLSKTFDVACSLDSDTIIFFCEDDYLFTKQAMLYIIDFFQNKSRYLGPVSNYNLFIHPPDYPDRYLWPDPHTQALINPTPIFLSQFCHWRAIPSTTFTLFCEKKAFTTYKDIFYASAPNWDDGLLSRGIYTKEVCLSPMPGLASHMHEVAMSPIVDWNKVIKDL